MYTKKHILRIIKDLKSHKHGLTKNVTRLIDNVPSLQSKYIKIIRKNSISPYHIGVNNLLIQSILPMLHSSYVIDK